MMLDQLLDDYPVVVEITVAWGDMDAFQHVNNTAYFRYFENARIVYFDKIGIIDLLRQTGIGPILASTSCTYKLPLAYPDTISVSAKTKRIEEDRMIMKYAVVSLRHQKLAAEGDGVVVMYNYRESKKTAMPDEIRKRIIDLEKM